jgi:ribosomal protein S21|tara:strand:+ start:592 stop:783 length:192 start_codon:yes stop_codon:yes gene_type:complete
MLKIKVKKGNIERALKDYKSKVIKTRQMKKINERKEYEKPSVKYRRLKEKGKYKERKKREDEL